MSLARTDQKYNAETTLNESYILVQPHENANPSVRIRQESRTLFPFVPAGSRRTRREARNIDMLRDTQVPFGIASIDRVRVTPEGPVMNSCFG